MNFRPRDPQQREQVELLAFLLNTTISEVLRRAVDALYERHAEQIWVLKPAYQAALDARDQAREGVSPPARD
jgi:hypothetical protein